MTEKENPQTVKQNSSSLSKIKSRRSCKKRIPKKRLDTLHRDEDSLVSMGVASRKRGLTGGTIECKEQKYFIVVEEKSAKGVENFIFFVEEKPLQGKHDVKRNQKAHRKKPRVESSKDFVTPSSTNPISSSDYIDKDINLVTPLSSVSAEKCDIDVSAIKYRNIRQLIVQTFFLYFNA